jgi:hypothetical protein
MNVKKKKTPRKIDDTNLIKPPSSTFAGRARQDVKVIQSFLAMRFKGSRTVTIMPSASRVDLRAVRRKHGRTRSIMLMGLGRD